MTAAEETKFEKIITHTFPWDGHFYYAEIKAGKILRWYDDAEGKWWNHSGHIPTRVLKKALKAWRKLNLPRDRYEMPQITSKYAITVLLKDWLAEKMGTK